MWISWVEDYFTDHGFSEETKISFAYGFMEDVALLWFQESQAVFTSWNEVKIGLLQRFRKGKDSIVAVLTESDDFDSKMSRWSSCLDRLEKYILDTGERFEKPNLKDEEKEITVFVDDSTMRDETHQQGEKNQTDLEMTKDACQVFDEISIKGNKKKTKKKKRWKKLPKTVETERHFNIDGDKGFVKLFTKKKERKRRKFTQPKRSKYKFGKHNFCGSAARIYNGLKSIETSKSSATQGDTKKRKRWKKLSKTYNCCKSMHSRWLYNQQVINIQFMSIFTKKKRGKGTVMEFERKGHKYCEYIHGLVYTRLSLGYITVTNKRSKWRKHKFKQKSNKHEKRIKVRFSRNQEYHNTCQMFHKKSWKGEHVEVERKIDCTKPHKVKFKTVMLDYWKKMVMFRRVHKFRINKTLIVRGLPTLVVTNMTTDYTAAVLGSLRSPKKSLKRKMKMMSWVVLVLEKQDKHSYRVIMDGLIMGVEAVKENRFRAGKKRYRFRHIHKKKVMMFLTIHKKRAFVEHVLRVKKRARLKR
ncbi:uncharacterized protein LOC111830465 isoform X2 [Capsella rubella]|uniref:uncharacterized protein LOC111830465 isoform X2 n=1 Tax=Capsella rubella TaxID=81985 RepID=UPI000CD4ED65|nr:uncharacterized protein LOC111830465 isoform X2 [Capsella rubella]